MLKAGGGCIQHDGKKNEQAIAKCAHFVLGWHFNWAALGSGLAGSLQSRAEHQGVHQRPSMRWRMRYLQVQAQRPDQPCLSVAKKAVQLFIVAGFWVRTEKTLLFLWLWKAGCPCVRRVGLGSCLGFLLQAHSTVRAQVFPSTWAKQHCCPKTRVFYPVCKQPNMHTEISFY